MIDSRSDLTDAEKLAQPLRLTALKEDPLKSGVKRLFDVMFSLFAICFILSWLIPIIGLIIVLESKGPIFGRDVKSVIRFNHHNFFCNVYILCRKRKFLV